MTTAAENTITTPEQRRAQAAWAATKGMSGDPAKDFSSLCKQTTARILNSGLLPTLAFLDAKGKDADANKPGPSGQSCKCRDALTNWLASFAGSPSGGVKELLNHLMTSDGMVLRRAQAEALAYLEWLARFAEGRAGAEGGEK
ncbi:MAG: type III-B CRISPR module-associated protein Cmr5 [Candidatus Omnitrophica bacterium]|nr:type III-B CRISPR module-associated protein Cmr5 [Candidatus Omnitrophota bacterium]